jgi:SAM-dependent methyltransferase
MRLGLRSDNIVEWLALRAGLVPTPAAEVWGGMALSGVLIAATQSGLTARLAQAPATPAELAADLDLDPTALGLVLDFLRASGHLSRRGPRYRLSRRSRRWLDPASPISIATFVEGNVDYWQWWSTLTEITRTGKPVSHHDAEPDAPYWRRYITGQLELARLSAREVARRIRVPDGARTVLDIGGGHGWYSAELCRRYPQLTATVLDLAGSAKVGRDIIERAGLADRVSHRDGDVLTSELGGPYDVVLCFNLIHHLGPEQVVQVLSKIRAALAPGGSLAILDAFAAPTGRRTASASYLGLFMYLSSGAGVYTPDQLAGWLDAAGFVPARRSSILRIPGLGLYQAGVRDR